MERFALIYQLERANLALIRIHVDKQIKKKS